MYDKIPTVIVCVFGAGIWGNALGPDYVLPFLFGGLIVGLFAIKDK